MPRAEGAAFTYDPDASPQTDLGVVRGMIGDVNEDQPLLYDGEINRVLTARNNDHVTAAIDCVLLILGLIARDTDADGAGTRANRSQKTTHYRELLKDLRKQVVPVPELRGQSKAQLTAREADTDWPSPAFKRGMFDY